jgi:hypothetical protein
MKLFTPELYVRGQSHDPAVLNEVDGLWEAANERYEDHLRQIEPELPGHVREFIDLPLHDAAVWGIARRADQLVMVLRKNVPPRDLVVLTYTLAEEPFIDCEALPPEHRSSAMDFLYDEFDLVRDGDVKHYTQSILFGNGWEVRLRFRDVRVALADPVYAISGPMPTPPVPQTGS